MSNITLILLGAGSSTRFATNVKKQWLYNDETPLWLHVAKRFEDHHTFDKIIIVSTAQEIIQMQHFANYHYVVGGDSRQASLSNALAHVDSKHVLVSDIARCCIPQEVITRIIDVSIIIIRKLESLNSQRF